MIFSGMNSVIVTCCVLFVLAVLPAHAVRGVLATAAGSLFEGTPFILAGIAAQALLSRFPATRASLAALLPFLGCGCGSGASARSLPAAAATAMTFGPLPALLRVAAALLVSRFSSRRSCEHAEAFPAQLAALLPAAVLAGLASHAFGEIDLARASPFLQWLGGALAGFATAPCALGAVALAAALHARAPFAALGMLCTSGIIDARALLRARVSPVSHDAVAYTILALALSLVAWHGGDALVHPRFCLPLASCAAACAALAIAHRRTQSPRARLAPALMLAGAVLGAPAPVYTATETTLTDLFAGEHLTFTGTLVHGVRADALVRFAITCCRADAAPVVVRLAGRVHAASGTWIHAQGVVAQTGDDLRLTVRRVETIAPPSDPFIYR
ncbi:MAG: TIGR03943 family putative permease subunit [Candidatus Tyrphobacter sp.]